MTGWNMFRFTFVRGLKTGGAWKAIRAAKEAKVVGELFDGLQAKFDSRLYVKASQLNQLLDNCETTEDFDLAVKAVRGFRKSLSKPRESTGSVFVRASCRVGAPEKALEIIRDKLQYGIFPTRSGFNMIMKEFLKLKDYDNAIRTFDQMIENDEIKPSAQSYHLAIQALCMKETTDDYRRAIQLAKKSSKDSIKLLERTHHCLAAAACRQEDPDTCIEMIAGLYTQAAAGLEIRALTVKGDYEKAIQKLVDVSVNFKTPAKTLDGLMKAVEESGIDSLKTALHLSS
ncbi:small ribosomal subunit protein mS27-like isoform X2 [Oscarella lobularis]|uniref:small ribosomal subunit protein mS27-like isoform X2 n=1 Tax=Oscarella lobularis TaxID=121494 RepID=UPI0033144B27